MMRFMLVLLDRTWLLQHGLFLFKTTGAVSTRWVSRRLQAVEERLLPGSIELEAAMSWECNVMDQGICWLIEPLAQDAY